MRDAVVKAGGTYRTERVRGLEDAKRFGADAYVFACGPWLGKLFPDVIGDRVRPTRQEIYYFGPPAGSDRYAPPRMPIWIDFGKRIVYGIPDLHGRGFKVADDTRGRPFDPSTGNRTPSAEGIARALSGIVPATEREPEHRPIPATTEEARGAIVIGMTGEAAVSDIGDLRMAEHAERDMLLAGQ